MERSAVRRNRSLLRLHAEMGPHFLERGFHPPTRGEPAADGGGLRVEIGTEKRGWLMLTGWVTDQNPADRGPRASMCPEASAALGTGAIPVWYQSAVPVATSSLRCWALYN